MVKIGDEDCTPVDRKIKYCPRCGRCWEQYNNGNKNQFVRYYRTFPKIGKQERICRICIRR